MGRMTMRFQRRIAQNQGRGIPKSLQIFHAVNSNISR